MSNFFAIFPTTVARYKYDKPADVKDTVNQLIQIAPTFRKSGNDTATHYYEDNSNFLEDPGLLEFKNFLLDSASRYVNDLMMINTNLLIAGAWINKSDAGFSEGIHNHSNSYISGTYYVNFNSMFHGKLVFYKNSSNMALTPYLECVPSHINDLNAERFSIPDLEEGDLVLWPSNVEHGYLTPNDNDNRISISINFLPTEISNGMYKFKISKG